MPFELTESNIDKNKIADFVRLYIYHHHGRAIWARKMLFVVLIYTFYSGIQALMNRSCVMTQTGGLMRLCFGICSRIDKRGSHATLPRAHLLSPRLDH